MEDNEQKEVSHITVGHGTAKERDIPFANRLTFRFADHRLITIGELVENNGFAFTVENMPSSGRSCSNHMWLSEISFKSLVHSLNIYYASKGIDIAKEMPEIIGADKLTYWTEGDITCIFDNPKSE